MASGIVYPWGHLQGTLNWTHVPKGTQHTTCTHMPTHTCTHARMSMGTGKTGRIRTRGLKSVVHGPSQHFIIGRFRSIKNQVFQVLCEVRSSVFIAPVSPQAAVSRSREAAVPADRRGCSAATGPPLPVPTLRAPTKPAWPRGRACEASWARACIRSGLLGIRVPEILPFAYL